MPLASGDRCSKDVATLWGSFYLNCNPGGEEPFPVSHDFTGEVLKQMSQTDSGAENSMGSSSEELSTV